MALEIENLTKRFGKFPAVNNVSLTVEQGEFMALLGPSGSGKTTLLRSIGGLDLPEEGTLRFDGQDITHQPARERRVGFVFQAYALFRHMTVARNIAFGLDVKPWSSRPSRSEIRARVDALLARMQLDGLGDRYPSQLSGGQRQRVAVARALVGEPSLLLADEPTGNLDSRTSAEIMALFDALHAQGQTVVVVTHEPDIAAHCHRTVRIGDGRIVEDRRTR